MGKGHMGHESGNWWEMGGAKDSRRWGHSAAETAKLYFVQKLLPLIVLCQLDIKIDLSEGREPQLRHCLHKIGLHS